MRVEVPVAFEARDDAGLRAWSPEVPTFALSHSDADLVRRNIVPTLEFMLSAAWGMDVKVTCIPSE